MSNDSEITKGDIVEHLHSGQTFRVTSVVGGKYNVKGNGQSTTFSPHEVKKAPPRPART